MASAVGYLTGVPGVCVSTVGPGATNLTTGVGCAWLDRAPLLAITCNVATPWLERRIQMRIDHHKLFEPLTKASLACRHANVGEMFARAIVHRDARTARAGASRSSRRCRPGGGVEKLAARKLAPAALPDLSSEVCRGHCEALIDREAAVARLPVCRLHAQRGGSMVCFNSSSGKRFPSSRRYMAKVSYRRAIRICRRHRPGAAQRCQKIHRPGRSHYRRRLRSHRDQLRRVGEAGDADPARQQRSG